MLSAASFSLIVALHRATLALAARAFDLAVSYSVGEIAFLWRRPWARFHSWSASMSFASLCARSARDRSSVASA